MPRFFDFAGPCDPARHYMFPSRDRSRDLDALVDEGLYFVLHTVRQSGKTTLVRDFVDHLNTGGQYLAIYCSVATASIYEDAERGLPAVRNALERTDRLRGLPASELFGSERAAPSDSAVVNALTQFCRGLDKPLVLILDEIDSLYDHTLRLGFIDRDQFPFPHSVVLVGMRNIRDYRIKVSDEQETLGTASPFNLISQSLILDNFHRDELQKLVGQHTHDTGQAFSPEVIDRIFYYSNGQPWLCNAIAREVTRENLERDTTRRIDVEMIDEAVERIILRRDTHIDSLLARLSDERVQRVLEPVILGEQLDFTNDDMSYIFDSGLLKDAHGNVRPANRVYEEVIIRLLALKQSE